MSFPSMIHGTEGEQFSVYSEKRHPLGTLMALPDGRSYRFANIGGTAIATARVCQSEVPGANFDELVVPAAEAAEETTVEITNGATTIAANLFNEGYINVEDDAGEGHLYKIKSHEVEGAGSANFDVNIERGKFYDDDAGGNKHGLVVAWTSATTVGLTRNPYDDVIIHPSPPTAAVVGCTPRALAANKFGWLQVKGPASVLTEGTLVIADSVQPSSSADGAVTPMTLTEGTPNTEIAANVGVCMEVAATTEESLIALQIPGFS